ncbi:Angiopoietin-related protein 1-like 1 [Homarus americanus]|uniref:Angiopoietin-related protein 1-like 1 n=1 Tax=Homarus americanus TaxID=6706 RepID=A0A8J5JGU4_HOMAM|nr:Angiopoietin-related protein 1-like 1 [Homarus americanus]
MSVETPLALLLLAHTAVLVTGEVIPAEFPAHNYEESQSQSHDTAYIIGEAVASEFNRYVPALSDNLRVELNTMRNDLSRHFDSLKHYMNNKLDRMQRDAPSSGNNAQEEEDSLGEVSEGHTSPLSRSSGATIRHNLAMAELRRLGADLTRALDEQVGKLREELHTSLDHLRQQVQNSTESLTDRLQEEFSSKTDESTTMLKKVFFLTRNQMELIQSQLGNITSALHSENHKEPEPSINVQTTLPPTTETPRPTTPTTTPTTTPSTTTEAEVLPRDCREAQLAGSTKSGVTKIRPSLEMEPQRVWCDQEVDGGGWTVMLRRQRQPTQLDFRREWGTYAKGFGNPDKEYWIDMTWEDEEATSLYDFFSVGPARFGVRGYELNVGGYNESSTGGDAMEYHNGMDFSTYDMDNDGASGGSCSEWSGGGGWWYNFCFYSNPTGLYPPSDMPENTQVDHLLEWRKWQGYYTYLSTLIMMIRPN